MVDRIIFEDPGGEPERPKEKGSPMFSYHEPEVPRHSGPCRPLRDWIAVEILEYVLDEEDVREGLALPQIRRGERWLRGKVVCLGPLASGLDPGDTIVYEAHSAHPGQTGPLDAGAFGGTAGRPAVLLKCRNAKPSAAEDDILYERRWRRLKHLREQYDGWPFEEIPSGVFVEEAHLQRTMREINDRRRTKARSRRKVNFDEARGEGIIAISLDAG